MASIKKKLQKKLDSEKQRKKALKNPFQNNNSGLNEEFVLVDMIDMLKKEEENKLQDL